MAVALPKEDKVGCSFFTVMREKALMIKVRNNIIILLKKAMMDLQHMSTVCVWSDVGIWVKVELKNEQAKQG